MLQSDVVGKQSKLEEGLKTAERERERERERVREREREIERERERGARCLSLVWSRRAI